MTPKTLIPWKNLFDAGWRIVGMNHYHLNSIPHLFCSMAKNGQCITAEGTVEAQVFRDLELVAGLSLEQWTPARQQLPTRADADEFGEIYWCNPEFVRRESISDVLAWDWSNDGNLTGYWMRTGVTRPKPPITTPPKSIIHKDWCAAEQDVRCGFDHIRDCDCGAQ